MDTLKQIGKDILYRSLLAVLKKILPVILPYLLIFFLTTLVILSIFGAVPSEEISGKAEVQRYVEGHQPPTVSKYGQEEYHRLPWGTVMSVEFYAGNFSKEVDMDRVKRVEEALRPRFTYIDYTERTWKKETHIDENGNTYEEWAIAKETPVKLLTVADDMDGVTRYSYREVREEEGDTKRQYMVPDGMTVVPAEPTRFQEVLAQELKVPITYTEEQMVLNTANGLMYGGGEEALEFLGRNADGERLVDIPQGFEISYQYSEDDSAEVNRLLDNPKVSMDSSCINDVMAGRIDIRAARMINALSTKYDLYISSMMSNHTTNVAGTGRRSLHSVGRAFDISRVNGQRVINLNQRGSLAYQLEMDILAMQDEYRLDEVGGPWDLGGITFTNSGHKNHIHVGFK